MTAFDVRDATFQTSGTGRADSRLWASPPELYVSRVTVTLEPVRKSPATKPLAFDATSEAKLREWNVQWDSGSKPSFSRTTAPDGSRWLEIQAHGELVGGSWRTCPLLEAGAYGFVARVR